MIALIGSRSMTVRLRRAIAALGAIAVTLGASSAAAEERGAPTLDYCQKVTARADGDAALLFAPTVAVQVIRYPNAVGAADPTGLQVGQGVQPRAGVSIGLLDIYKGFGVLDVA